MVGQWQQRLALYPSGQAAVTGGMVVLLEIGDCSQGEQAFDWLLTSSAMQINIPLQVTQSKGGFVVTLL